MKPALQSSRRHLAPRDKLGKYEVIRQIAIGGMAELYLARTSGIEGFEKLVVLKRILPQYLSNASFVNMFLNEARIAATLHHGNIAQVYDIGVEEGDYFFAMEYVHGEDLDHMLIASEEQGVPISMDAALTLVAGLCAGLHYAHEKANAEGKPLQIVHRDVSPSNVLVSYDGSVKLVDFGIARATSRAGTTQTTNTGALKGKIAYMSPEQCKARAQLDRRSDIYAVGTILYELTTGRPPFKGETEYQILNQIVNEDAAPPSSIVPSYPSALERIVLRALAREVDQRYPTAVALQTDVEDFAHEMRLRISPLVLARLMGTLFPARLEEWDNAKSQGAFFVEQHVVRTLIESGKTPDAASREELVAALARETAETVVDNDDDATTSLTNPRHHTEEADTAVGPPAMLESSVLPIPAPPPTDQHVIAAPLEPPPTMPYPAVGGLATAVPGSLVTSTTSYGAPIAKREVTDVVRKKRQSTPTTFVRATGRLPLVVIVPSMVLAGAIAAVIVFMSLRNESQEPAPAEMSVEPKQEAPVEPPPETAEPVAEPVKAPEPKKATAKVEPKPKKKTDTKAKRPEPEAKKSETKKSETKKSKKPNPEESAWDAESPFMPVRTDKP